MGGACEHACLCSLIVSVLHLTSPGQACMGVLPGKSHAQMWQARPSEAPIKNLKWLCMERIACMLHGLNPASINLYGPCCMACPVHVSPSMRLRLASSMVCCGQACLFQEWFDKAVIEPVMCMSGKELPRLLGINRQPLRCSSALSALAACRGSASQEPQADGA